MPKSTLSAHAHLASTFHRGYDTVRLSVKELLVNEARVRIPVSGSAESLVLQGILARPEGFGPFPGVVICHPHPLYGGDMENNVVQVITRALVKQGIAALRFNFRGVGLSGGRHGEGIGEQEDVRAAL